MIGLPWYGYDWSSSASAVTYASAMHIAQTNAAAIARDANGEAIFTYADHTVYFQDATSFERKIDMLRQRHPGIGGFTAWAAEMEDPLTWTVIRGTNTPATPAPEMTDSGPASLARVQGQPGSADFQLTGNVAVSVIIPATLDQTTVNPGETVRITICATAPGNHTVVMRGTGVGLVRDQSLAVMVTPTRRRSVRQ